MKFCGKCGTQMENNVKFCPSCGEAQTDMADPVAAVKDTVVKHKQMILKVAVVAVAAVLVIVLLAKLFTPGYKKVANKYLDAIEDMRVDKMLDCWPDFMTEDLDKDELKELQEEADDEMDGIKISCKITETEKMSDETIEAMENTFDLYYDKSVNIKKGYVVTADMTLKKDGEKETMSFTFQVIKIGSKWYVYQSSLSFLY